MYSFDKIFNDGDKHTIRIFCREAYLFVASAFDIESISALSYGDFDTDEYSFFPSNLTVRFTAYPVNYYNTFKAEFERYSQNYPFNFKETFYIEYYINDVLKHTGIINSVKFEDEREEIELTLTDASEKYKEVVITNPYYLSNLAANGLPEHVVPMPDSSSDVKFYGLGNAYIDPWSYDGKYKVYPGTETTDISDWKLTKFMDVIFRTINPSCSINYYNDLLFADNPEMSGGVNIEELYLYALHSYYLGRYIVVSKLSYPNILFQMDTTPVYEDDNYITFRYGNDGPAEVNIINIIKNLSQNFFSRPIFKSFNEITFTKKYSPNPEEAIEIKDSDIVKPDFEKEPFIPKAKFVYVFDNFRTASSSRGGYAKPADNVEKVEFSINFSAFQSSVLSGYSLYYFNNGTPKGAVFCKDPVTGYNGYISEVLAELEWRFRQLWRDKIPMSLWGTDWEYDKVYKFRHPNAFIYLRAMKMERDTEHEQCNFEFIDITEY